MAETRYQVPIVAMGLVDINIESSAAAAGWAAVAATAGGAVAAGAENLARCFFLVCGC